MPTSDSSRDFAMARVSTAVGKGFRRWQGFGEREKRENGTEEEKTARLMRSIRLATVN